MEHDHYFELTDNEHESICKTYAGKSIRYSIVSPTTGERAEGVGTLIFRNAKEKPLNWWAVVITATDEELDNPYTTGVVERVLPRRALDLLRPGVEGDTDWILDGLPPQERAQ